MSFAIPVVPQQSFWPATPYQNLMVQQRRLPRLPLSSNRLPHRPLLLSLLSRSRERKRLRPKTAQLKERKRDGCLAFHGTGRRFRRGHLPRDYNTVTLFSCSVTTQISNGFHAILT